MDTITEQIEKLTKIGTECADVYNRAYENRNKWDKLIGAEVVKGIPFNEAYYNVIATVEGRNIRDLDNMLSLRKVELGFQYDACKLSIEAMIHLDITESE
jgi:hypothetical protein